MKSILTGFAALTALFLPAGLPAIALAQDEVRAEQTLPANDVGGRFQPGDTSAPAVRNRLRERPEARRAQDREGNGGDRGGGRENRDSTGDAGGRRGDRGGGDGIGGRNRDREGQARDYGGRGEGRVGRNRADQPTAPVITAAPQDRGARDRDRSGQVQDWSRRNEGRDRDRGGREYGTSQDGRQRVAPRGSFADSCSGSYVNQGRLYADCRDTRGNVRGTSVELARCSSSDIGNDNGLLVCNNVRGDYEGRRGNSGGWDRDRNAGGRQWNDSRRGRRDYGDFRNRWNQNDWRRDWNRSRSHDWWRNDRGFRGYTGFRSGFYFAPNYGYYAVPRSYFGQRWAIGSYLPSTFWRYSLNDYRTYGLGYPPPGTQWVAVDTTIYLIDSRDGYIIEVIYDAWRW